LRDPCWIVDDPASIEKAVSRAEQVLRETPNAVGVAAPQVGQQLQWFVTKSGLFLNPEILERRSPTVVMEGCLSIPKTWFKVPRYDEVVVEWQDLRMQTWRTTHRGLDAAIMQHEVDHLRGTLIDVVGQVMP
jgi:peptide deformylase